MKQLKTMILAATLAVTGVANAAGSIFLTEPGADGFNIETGVFNGSSYDITKLTFDFSGTTTTDSSFIVIDGTPLGTTDPAGGTSTFFGSGAVFGFNFTSFNTFDTFKFKWDPDSNVNGSYGATALDCENTISSPNNTNTTTIGISQYFFSSRRNWMNSESTRVLAMTITFSAGAFSAGAFSAGAC